MGQSRSGWVREAIAPDGQRFSNGDEEVHRQSALMAEHSGSAHWREQLPAWADWTAQRGQFCNGG